jgi:uncharacterized protein (DUF427 family)
MAKAVWQGATLAESDGGRAVEDNYYFPPQSVNRQYVQPSAIHTTCPWKGDASYYDVVVNEQRNTDAAWYYPSPKEAAKSIAGYVAFWKGIEVNDR